MPTPPNYDDILANTRRKRPGEDPEQKKPQRTAGSAVRQLVLGQPPTSPAPVSAFSQPKPDFVEEETPLWRPAAEKEKAASTSGVGLSLSEAARIGPDPREEGAEKKTPAPRPPFSEKLDFGAPAPRPRPERVRRAAAEESEKDLRASMGDQAFDAALRFGEAGGGDQPAGRSASLRRDAATLRRNLADGQTGPALERAYGLHQERVKTQGPGIDLAPKPGAPAFAGGREGYAEALRKQLARRRWGVVDKTAEEDLERGRDALLHGVKNPVDRPEFQARMQREAQEEAEREKAAQKAAQEAELVAKKAAERARAEQAKLAVQARPAPQSPPSLVRLANYDAGASGGASEATADQTMPPVVSWPSGRAKGSKGAARAGRAGALGSSLKSTLLKLGKASGVGLAAEIILSPGDGMRAPEIVVGPDGLLFKFGSQEAEWASGRSASGEIIPLADIDAEEDEDGVSLHIPGAEALGPIARVTGEEGARSVAVLRPELFDGATSPEEVALRVKRALLAPLILGGPLPGYGEGVEPERFDEAYDPDRIEPGPMVTPIPEPRGPGAVVTPDESDRIAAELREAWIKGGFQALPEHLRGPQIWEIRRPPGGLNEENFAGFLDDVRGFLNHVPKRIPRADGTDREVPRNIPRLGDYIPERGDKKGTVAALEVGEKIYLGVNSGALNDRGLNKLAGQLVKEQFDLRMIGSQPWHHAESMAVIRAYFDQIGALPDELTMYIDRDTCEDCEKLLPAVLSAVGVTRLTIFMKSGERIAIEKGPLRLETKR